MSFWYDVKHKSYATNHKDSWLRSYIERLVGALRADTDSRFSTHLSGGTRHKASDIDCADGTSVQTSLEREAANRVLSDNDIIDRIGNISINLSEKVDREDGKGLSSNDFTDNDKSKLDGIESGAQVNAVTSVNGKTGSILIDAYELGLERVDNTSDDEKPVSDATRAALEEKAPINHAVKTDEYGVGTSIEYGHLRLADNLHTVTPGFALSAKQGKILDDKIEAMGAAAPPILTEASPDGTAIGAAAWTGTGFFCTAANTKYKINFPGTEIHGFERFCLRPADNNGMWRAWTPFLDTTVTKVPVQIVTETHTSEFNGQDYDNEYYCYTAPDGYKITAIMYDTGTYSPMPYESFDPSNGKVPISASNNIWTTVEPCDKIWLWESESQLTGTKVYIAIEPVDAEATTSDISIEFVYSPDRGLYEALIPETTLTAEELISSIRWVQTPPTVINYGKLRALGFKENSDETEILKAWIRPASKIFDTSGDIDETDQKAIMYQVSSGSFTPLFFGLDCRSMSFIYLLCDINGKNNLQGSIWMSTMNFILNGTNLPINTIDNFA